MEVCAICRLAPTEMVDIDRCGVPHGLPEHRVVYRRTSLVVCPSCDTGKLIRFDHDCFAPPWEEPWDMSWAWPVVAGGLRRLRAVLLRCPAPTQATCDCALHRSLRDSAQDPSPSAAVVTIRLTRDGLPQLLFPHAALSSRERRLLGPRAPHPFRCGPYPA